MVLFNFKNSLIFVSKVAAASPLSNWKQTLYLLLNAVSDFQDGRQNNPSQFDVNVANIYLIFAKLSWTKADKSRIGQFVLLSYPYNW